MVEIAPIGGNATLPPAGGLPADPLTTTTVGEVSSPLTQPAPPADGGSATTVSSGRFLPLTALGLTAPRTYADAQAILALVSDKLESTIAESRKQATATRGEEARTAFQTVLSALESLVTAQGQIIIKTAERNEKQEEKANKESQISRVDGQIAQTTVEIAGLQLSLNQVNISIAQTQSQISTVQSLTAERESLLGTTDPIGLARLAVIDAALASLPSLATLEGRLEDGLAERASLTTTIAARRETLSDLQAERAELTEDVGRLDGEIAQLNQEITALSFSLAFGLLFLIPLLLFSALQLARPDELAVSQEMMRTEETEETVRTGLTALQEYDGFAAARERILNFLQESNLDVADIDLFTLELLANTAAIKETLDTVQGLVGEPVIGERSEEIGLLGALAQTSSASVSGAERVRLGL